MAACIPDISAISTEWLRECLSSHLDPNPGDLVGHRILERREGPLSSSAVVGLDSRVDRSKLPGSLFVKITKAPDAATIGRKEVTFYAEILPRFADQTEFVRCYFARCDGDLCNLLFEDLSRTHTNSEWPLPQTASQCDLAIDCLAKLHASWWESSALEALIGPFPDRQDLVDQASSASAVFEEFIGFMGDRLSPARQELLRYLIKRIDRFIDRFASFRAITFIHSDNHLWNFMFPRDSSGTTKIRQRRTGRQRILRLRPNPRLMILLLAVFFLILACLPINWQI